MGVVKTTTKEGKGPIPQKGQTVAMEYTGYLKDTTKPDNKGAKYVLTLRESIQAGKALIRGSLS